MAFRHGKNTKVLMNAYDVSAYLNESSVSETLETGETTVYGKSAKTYIPGLRDATLSLSGLFDGDANASDELFAAAVAAAADDNFTVAPEGLAVGRRLISLASIQTSHETSSPVADVVSLSVEAQADDRIDRGVSLCDLAAATSTGNGTSVDNSASSANGGCGTLHVSANTRNGATTFKVQHSADNSTWADLVTFSSVGSTTTTSERVQVTGTVNRYTRESHTLAGSTGSITFHINFARR